VSDRTICQMEVDPRIIRWQRERSELFKRWKEIYGGNPFANANPQQQYAGGLAQSLLGALLGNLGSTGAGAAPYERQP